LTPVAADRTAIVVGTLGSPHGLGGHLRLWASQPGAPSLVPGASILLERDDAWLAAEVAGVAPHGRAMRIALAGVTGRDAAAGLTGMRVLVRAADLPPLEDGEFYHHEVQGFAVVTTDGRTLGTIAETFSTGTNDVFVVRDGSREHLIPVIGDVVRTIDRAARRVTIDPMPGLLE
jgi:16S rRNA processing protein RimM